MRSIGRPVKRSTSSYRSTETTGRRYETRPGRTPLETLEENILQILDSGKAKSGDVAKRYLSEANAAVVMATSGARGSMDNLAMMAGSIGQPKVRGKRLERGYQDRVLSHFPRGSKGAKEKGFVSSSFKRGLEPTEFFMLSVSGRESLVDTAVRTSKSGYMQRRLINAMDDLKVNDDLMDPSKHCRQDNPVRVWRGWSRSSTKQEGLSSPDRPSPRCSTGR